MIKSPVRSFSIEPLDLRACCAQQVACTQSGFSQEQLNQYECRVVLQSPGLDGRRGGVWEGQAAPEKCQALGPHGRQDCPRPSPALHSTLRCPRRARGRPSLRGGAATLGPTDTALSVPGEPSLLDALTCSPCGRAVPRRRTRTRPPPARKPEHVPNVARRSGGQNHSPS